MPVTFLPSSLISSVGSIVPFCVSTDMSHLPAIDGGAFESGFCAWLGAAWPDCCAADAAVDERQGERKPLTR